MTFIRTPARAITDCCGSNTSDVFVVGLDGLDLRKIGTDVGDWGVLTWSPDSSRVVAVNLASDQVIVLAVDPAIGPVSIASPNNVGVVSWQAVR